MYGRTEHRYYLRRLGDVNRELDCQREIVATLEREQWLDFDLNERPPTDAEHASRTATLDAGMAIAAAMRAVDQAVALLPTPVA